MACTLPADPSPLNMENVSMEWIAASMQAFENKMSKRVEMLERRADLLEKIFVFVDIDTLNKAISLATGHQCGAALVPACRVSSLLGSSLMNAACGLVHRTFLGSQTRRATAGRQRRQSRESYSDQVPSTPLATVDEVDVESSMSLVSAAEIGHVDIVSKLISTRADPNATNEDCETALHRAAYKARSDVVELLLNARADPSARDRKGKTPMRKAYDNADIVAALLKAGADPNVADENRCTTLHLSVENGHLDVIEVLLEAGADANNQNIDQVTPLHEAANFGQLDSLSALLRARGDPNGQDGFGSTPLHFAAFGDHVSIAKLLVESRANVLLPNEDGDTALDIAEQYEKPRLAELLRTCIDPAKD